MQKGSLPVDVYITEEGMIHRDMQSCWGKESKPETVVNLYVLPPTQKK